MAQPDKKRPLGERLAGQDCKTAYRDIRDGIGGSRSVGLSDQDIAAALGMVRASCGKFPVYALETYYGSTLRYEAQLRGEWLDTVEHHTDEPGARIRKRFSAAIAIRQFAGIVHTTGDMAEYAFFMFQRPKDFQRQLDEILSWLEELRAEGLGELRKKLAEPRAPLDTTSKTATIATIRACPQT